MQLRVNVIKLLVSQNQYDNALPPPPCPLKGGINIRHFVMKWNYRFTK